jgi:hypothetical protein
MVSPYQTDALDCRTLEVREREGEVNRNKESLTHSFFLTLTRSLLCLRVRALSPFGTLRHE